MASEVFHHAFVLHTRKYRDTSLIVDFFTQDLGRVSAVARGARGRKPRFQVSLQPFTPLLIAFYGRQELKTLRLVDSYAPPVRLVGDRAYLGLYVNELLTRLLGKFEQMQDLYQDYETLLVDLGTDVDEEPILRKFEIALLRELGYGISFDIDAVAGQPIESDAKYRFVADRGFILAEPDNTSDPAGGTVSGSHLLRIQAGDYDDPATRRTAKQVTRTAINALLGGRKLKSRELFKQ